ncbi:hypothetical protein AVEN_166039-1 [Araneus ventricosus]|uniref:Integrase catalytic domain-containing protein n=1 Tax=Araneus ventricosus TaxID=182803 RepID=A0A4Y2SX14_ARAVE|nr:hypothetical protein AVEN_166039-1 [Araneus ventricosus]
MWAHHSRRRIALDILEFFLITTKVISTSEVMDYFTKWPRAIPIPDRKPRLWLKNSYEVSGYGVPMILHSDQRCNFNSALFAELQAFGSLRPDDRDLHPESDGMDREI